MPDSKISDLTALAVEPATDDVFPIVDTSVAETKKITWATIKTATWTALGALINGGTAKSTPADGDLFPIADSAASNATKKVSFTNLWANYLKAKADAVYSALGHTHTGTYEPANANIQSHISNTSNPHSTTAAQVGALGYTLSVSAALQATATDGDTLYWGSIQAAPSTSAAIARVYIPKAGTIKVVYIFTRAVTTGSGEDWSMYIRLNNSSDTLIETEASSGNVRIFANTSLNIAVAQGEYIEIKEVCPTWATNPANIIRGGYIYIEP